MEKLLAFGRKAMFYVRIISGYEERRIRAFRLQIQQRLQQSEAKNAAINKIPEQMMLKEVRRVVEDMQALNKRLEESETAIDDYLKPINKDIDFLMKTKHEGESRTEKMMRRMQTQALIDQVEAERAASLQVAKANAKTHKSTSVENKHK